MVIHGQRFRDDDKGWAACPRCSELMEARDFDAMVTRSVDFYYKRFGGRIHQSELYQMLDQLFRLMDANRVGPKEPWKH